MCLNVELDIFSPRWDHIDVYNVTFEQSSLTIELNGKKAICKYISDHDPVWEGHESIDSIFRNDSIVAPINIEDLFESLWLAWRNGEITSLDAEKELKELATWINTITESKPKTDFWTRHF